jgi:hypothetical protein
MWKYTRVWLKVKTKNTDRKYDKKVKTGQIFEPKRQ